MYLYYTLGFIAVVLVIGVVVYLVTPRSYESSDTVATSYDEWTQDGILEFYWGEHIHLGHYGSPPRSKDFLEAKADFVHEMVKWGGLDKLPRGTTVLDVGCGIGGSSRILAKAYGFETTGVTISPKQVQRATELTPEDVTAKFQVDDALNLSFPDNSFDVVWSIEAGPHMPDKAKYAQEMVRVLKPGGLLVVADWNQRDDRQKPLNFWEKPVMRQLLDQWSHPSFSSIEGFSEQIAATGLIEGEVITADWTKETLPSWLESIWQGIVRPQGLIKFGFSGFIKSLREVPTMLLMRLGFGAGLCRFGMFRAIKSPSVSQSTQTAKGETVNV
ncbi:methyltransferase domain-containing protein [Crocosphaera watsonii WH 8501]|uniref:2-methyl-6-phytyl-1,4-benzoquinone methyltransferase / 2-methyl-6-solanyl-1,4-benzoquinone methyltransferase n=7 Tax=Crocosphaera TaxID=263510 RepID=T2JQS5_CROWT|nr:MULTISPECIES: methyltransferase domain-containing protein [Crocosphaera]EAM51621.1 probable delta(24)-sterol C-methyltransferase [Crocosphaera watsonii WH 8501]EHJ13476.1 2-methyl-6-phytyl-1,4-benzoquinone methyltransferase / 2-methyl-6-solanyl-1,4-benzoquinone methyltransferase [Crocosphaera watsonii WH 0003]MCH2247014.1 methyltransferase domain-containing protein [Crocosphaera sp.]CCQ51357.1 2-methyl-6-phytyl-1,4-benzoquinone methyltransferase / 2-methyl-6-solanyl-1,4-benzoquinone methyltr